MDKVVGRRNLFTSDRRCGGRSDLRLGPTGQRHILYDQQKQIEALTAGLQRVSAQVELNKVAAQTVKNND